MKYQHGFNNEHLTEALKGAVPIGRNSPQKPPLGLYPEQLSGSAFTMPRKENFRSWLYRIRPSVVHGEFSPYPHPKWLSAPSSENLVTPMQLRWNPLPDTNQQQDFLDGIETFALNGGAKQRQGSAIHLFRCNKNMTEKYFYNSDGEMLIVPQRGRLLIKSEFGFIETAPTEICVIPEA